ncbi:MAG: hypothetical protein IKQ77_07100 [Prevotella sp.]|nr:hypothetical protein [Prevotella sp.]
MKRFLSTLFCTIVLTIGAQAQIDEVVNQINKDGGWNPRSQWLQNKEIAERYLMRIMEFSSSDAKWVQGDLDQDHERALKVLQVRDQLIGNIKKVKKQDKILSKYFNDVSQARQAFAQAETTEMCYKMLSGTLNGMINHTVTRKMPSGPLTYFRHSISNGYAGTHDETILEKKDGKGRLAVNMKNMRMNPEDRDKEPVWMEVEDSVFQHVRDMVEAGLLYDVNPHYSPAADIMDASNWSMDFYFEGGKICSDGYAVRPDHSECLDNILRYLFDIYKECGGPFGEEIR